MGRRNQRRHDKQFGSDLEVSFKLINEGGGEDDEMISNDDDGLDIVFEDPHHVCSASEDAKSDGDESCEVSCSVSSSTSISDGGEEEEDQVVDQQANKPRQADRQDHLRVAEIFDVEEEDEWTAI